jgi:hypothetical protein
LKQKQSKPAGWKWNLVTFRGKGMTEEFENAGWDRIRDEIYRGRGA